MRPGTRSPKRSGTESRLSTATLLASVLVTIPAVALADSWACPEETDYPSGGGGFVARVTPAKGDAKARVEVFRVSGSARESLWKSDLGNEGGPANVFLSRDGKHLATVNECSRRVHGGMGDFVVAFYNESGLVRNYSLEEVFHYPSEIDQKAFQRLFTQSTSGRSWATAPMFLDEHDGRLFLCVWLTHGRSWRAWDARTGEEADGEGDLIERWFEKGRAWARKACRKPQGWVSGLLFLQDYGKTEDRKLFETLLEDGDFRTEKIHAGSRIVGYHAGSYKRAVAERALAQWDGHAEPDVPVSQQRYRCLGMVRGTVELPEAPTNEDGPLGVFLLPAGEGESDATPVKPVHRLLIRYGGASHWGQVPPAKVAFSIGGITPGPYRIKVVWDRSRPYSIDENTIHGPPGQGDYAGTLPDPIEVKAGATVGELKVPLTPVSEVSRSSP